MLIGNKWFYIILGSLGTILIIVNLVLWSNQMNLGLQMAGYQDINDTWYTPQKYIGFENLFEYLGTFPGPAITHEAITTFCNVITNFDVSGIVVVDYVLAILRLIVGPVAVSVSIIGDIAVNLVWFFNLIFMGIFGNGDMFNKPQPFYDMPLN